MGCVAALACLRETLMGVLLVFKKDLTRGDGLDATPFLTAMFRDEGFYLHRERFLGIGGIGLKPFRPVPPRMQRVPRGFLLIVTAFAGVMVAKAVKHPVPQWREALYQQGFGEWNPNVVNGQETTRKITQFEVLGFIHRVGVFAKTIV